jgi:hypothetical protein
LSKSLKSSALAKDVTTSNSTMSIDIFLYFTCGPHFWIQTIWYFFVHEWPSGISCLPGWDCRQYISG